MCKPSLTGLQDLRRGLQRPELQRLYQLEADPEILSALHHRSLVASGIKLITKPACPLCDLPWPDMEALRSRCNNKLTDRTSCEVADSH